MIRFLSLVALVACPAFAQEKVYRLSEADKRAAIEDASRQPEQTTRLPIVSGRAPGSADRRVQSEVGMMVGTGGTRALYGSTYVPLGESGSAQLSFGTGRLPGHTGGRYGGGYGDDYRSGGLGDAYGNRYGFGRYADPRLLPF